MQENHYYPFGLQINGPWSTNPGRDNKYTYNGKELNEDFGLDWLDYGARWYNPAIGRWNAVDPLAEDYQSWSTYNYTLNNPLRYIDPTGATVEETEDKITFTDNHAVAAFNLLKENSKKNSSKNQKAEENDLATAETEIVNTQSLINSKNQELNTEVAEASSNPIKLWRFLRTV